MGMMKMKNNKGFIATSMIYSFFLVFLMLLVTMLATAINNRVLVGYIEDDIRTEMDGSGSFVTTVVEPKTYAVGEEISFANESWIVIQDLGSEIKAVLARSLTRIEIENAIGQSGNSQFYGTCTSASCQLRACFNASTSGTIGESACSYFVLNGVDLSRRAAWNPTAAQIAQRYGQSLVSLVVNSWFQSHVGLQRVYSQNKLTEMRFNDGSFTLTGYIRIPSTSEVSTASSWATAGGNSNLVPFHVLESVSSTQTKIYNTSLQTVNSNTAAYIRPVIQIKEG